MTATPRWRPAPAVVWQRGSDATFALDIDRRDPRPFRIDGGGALIWQLLAEAPSTVDELVAVIAERTGEPAATLAPAVAGYVEELHAAALVVASEA